MRVSFAKFGILTNFANDCNIRLKYAGELTFCGNDTLCGRNFWAVSPKRCYLGEGYGTLDQPGALKGAISEKEITIFEL